MVSASIVLQLVSSGLMSGTDSPSEDSVRFTKPIWRFIPWNYCKLKWKAGQGEG